MSTHEEEGPGEFHVELQHLKLLGLIPWVVEADPENICCIIADTTQQAIWRRMQSLHLDSWRNLVSYGQNGLHHELGRTEVFVKA